MGQDGACNQSNISFHIRSLIYFVFRKSQRWKVSVLVCTIEGHIWLTKPPRWVNQPRSVSTLQSTKTWRLFSPRFLNYPFEKQLVAQDVSYTNRLTHEKLHQDVCFSSVCFKVFICQLQDHAEIIAISNPRSVTIMGARGKSYGKCVPAPSLSLCLKMEEKKTGMCSFWQGLRFYLSGQIDVSLLGILKTHSVNFLWRVLLIHKHGWLSSYG